MGFLGGMFEKKTCDVCGNKIGLLGNRKLEDGNLCKDCAAKLSPWFSDRRHSTLAEIREQLDYREKNREAVRAFNAARTFGKYYKIYLDDNQRKLMVSDSSRLEEANPDVLDYSQITGCDLDIRENRTELKQKDKDGKQVSYNPPRYEYSYNFYCTIRVNSPYFDEMHFPLSAGSVRTGEIQMNQGVSNWRVRAGSLGLRAGVNEYQDYVNLGNEIKQALDEIRTQAQFTAGMIAAAEAEAQKIRDSMPEAMKARLELDRRISEVLNDPSLSPEERHSILEPLMEQQRALSAGMAQGAGTAAGTAAGAVGVAAGAAGAFAGAAGAAAGAFPGAPEAPVPGAPVPEAPAYEPEKMQAPDPAPAAAKVKCPWCGSMTSNIDGHCEFCTGDLS